jgi:lipoate-protein ligase A
VRIKILPYTHLEPDENMKTDLEMAVRSLKEKTFIFRWYGWRGLALSFGRSQCTEIEKFNIPLKKTCRPTGGGILLHGWDISFALTAPPGYFDHFLQLYRFVARTFVRTFSDLNVSVHYSRNKKGNYLTGKYCWNFPTFGEVVVKNKKLVAAAVRKFEEGHLLIHGSVYITFNRKFLEKKYPQLLKNFKNQIATLTEVNVKKSDLMSKFS